MAPLTIEDEVVYLRAITSLVDEMVNFNLFSLRDDDRGNTEVLFHSETHQRYFNIALVDLLSCIDEKAWPRRLPYLRALKYIVEKPNFDIENSVDLLRRSTRQFIDWLEAKQEFLIWLPTIEIETKIKLCRKMFIKMCGNIAKHNFLRSAGVARDLVTILTQAGHSITMEDALLALADFYERFHTDVLNYHGSTLVEFLNNIRWGIHYYLHPQYKQSMTRRARDAVSYQYIYPNGVSSPFAQRCYWDLMNTVAAEPPVKKFRVNPLLKLRY